jgi:hypothetical protein
MGHVSVKKLAIKYIAEKYYKEIAGAPGVLILEASQLSFIKKFCLFNSI